MIILRQNLYSDKSGKFWAGTKGALKGAGKGALWGAALAPGNIIAAKHNKWKLAAGITGAGALVGAGIGAKSGWKKGVNEYKYNNDPEYRKKVQKEKEERQQKALEYVHGTDEVWIYEFNVQSWINLKKTINVPDEFIKYIKFYKNIWSKNLETWYDNMNPEIDLIPEFKNLFPIPIKSEDAKDWYEDNWLCLATVNDAGDDGWRVVVVDASPSETGELVVEHAKAIHVLPDLLLAHGAVEVVVALEAYAFGDVGIELVEGTDACDVEHLSDVVVGVWKKLVVHGLGEGYLLQNAS